MAIVCGGVENIELSASKDGPSSLLGDLAPHEFSALVHQFTDYLEVISVLN